MDPKTAVCQDGPVAPLVATGKPGRLEPGGRGKPIPFAATGNVGLAVPNEPASSMVLQVPASIRAANMDARKSLTFFRVTITTPLFSNRRCKGTLVLNHRLAARRPATTPCGHGRPEDGGHCRGLHVAYNRILP
jgi:hypothetical protein